MTSTQIAYDIIARDKASREFRSASASAKQMQAEVKAAFNSQAQVASRSRSQMVAALKAQEAEMNKAALAAQKYGKATAAINRNQAGLNSVASGMAKVGVAAGVAFGAAVKAAADFDEGMSRVAATGKDAEANIDSLRKLAIEWGQKTKYSATEAADGITELGKAGVSVKDIMGGGLQGALNLAAAGQIDVAQAAEDAASAMNQFGLKGKDVPHIADLLAAAAGKAQGEVGDMALALKYVGPVAASMGVSIEQTTGAIAELASNGILADQAGTSLRGMLTALTSPSAKAAETMKSLGINVYDAKGNFIGFDGVAGQLHDRLGKLSNAQRDSALGTIFGNNQITAARILYKGGSKDVDKWTASVNDSGFAAETARKKMDNLKGDLEQLKGAAETALIGAGEGQQAPLRDMVKNITKVVNAWNDLSDETKTNIGRIVGSMAALGLGGAAVIKVITGVAAIRKQFIDLGLAGGPISALKELRRGVDSNSAALTTMGRAGRIAQLSIPIVGIALAAVTVAITHFQKQSAEAKQDVDDFGQALQQIKGNLDAVAIATDRMTRATAVQKLQQAGAYDAARKLGISYSTITDAALGNKDALDLVNGKLDEQQRLLAPSANGNRKAADGAKLNSEATIKLNEALGKTSGSLRTATAQERQRRAAMQKSDAATQTASSSQQTLAQKAKFTSQMVKLQVQELKKQRDAMIKSANAAIAASNSQIAFKQSIVDANKAAKSNAHTLDVNTKAGRDNRTALNNLASSALSYVQDLIKNKASTDKVTSATKEARQAFIKTAQQMGATKAQAKKLADQYGLIPKKVDTRVSTPGYEQAKKNLDNMITTVSKVHGKTVTVKYNVLAGGAAIKVAGHGNIVATGGDTFRAAGGPIHGPGTKTSDDVPIWASKGEFMEPAHAVDYYGQDVMEAMRQHRVPREVFQGLAAGGPVKVNTEMAAGGSTLARLMSAANSTANTAASSWLTEALKKGVRLGSDSVTSWHGGKFTQNFARHLQMVYDALPFQVYQGGWNAGGVGASAGTHDKDAIDAGKNYDMLAKALTGIGIQSWHRTPSQGPWVDHTHGIPSPNTGLASAAAAAQYRDYLRGGNGLGGGGGTDVGDISTAGLSGGTSGANQKLGYAMMLKAGWAASQWPALKALWNGESGWNANALNRASGAAGIPQALGHGHVFNLGDARAQIAWGLNYIRGSYGSPSAAYSKWLGRNPHWYANGTNSAAPGLAVVGERGPELVNFRGGEQVIPHMANGGPVSASKFGSSSSFSVAKIVSLVRAVTIPTRELAKFTGAVKAASAAARVTAKQVAKPQRVLAHETADYNRARRQQANLRLTNAKQTESARAGVAKASDQVKKAQLALQKMAPANSKIAKAQSSLLSAENSLTSKRKSADESIAKINDKIRQTKKGTLAYQNLITERTLKQKANARAIADAEDKVHAAKKAADKAGVNTTKISKAQAALTKAQSDLDKAHAKQSKVSRENALQSAEASNKVAKALAVKKKAQDAYNKAADRAKAKADALKASNEALAQAQQQVADATKQTSDAFTGMYNQATTSNIVDLLASMRKGASDIASFGVAVDKLRKEHVSESVIDQIQAYAQSNGIAAGLQLATQAGSSGSDLVSQLNAAAQKLQDAGDIFGYKDATARGGYASGTTWATPGLHLVGEKGPEVVRFRGGESVTPNNKLGMLGPAGPQTLNVNLTFNGPVDKASVAREFEAILRDYGQGGRFTSGVRQGSRTRGN